MKLLSEKPNDEELHKCLSRILLDDGDSRSSQSSSKLNDIEAELCVIEKLPTSLEANSSLSE